ncbi:MAG: hypothetical protein KGJ89_03570 [Patescibacteria group bacterium]|nr:hypothetical protein [Patescibacteria group bacterium]MDE2015374.1 hypothetical protein [Patescibacteria group bacterium]MDE2227011.1 hypothetical protein [Patescibacteria group bacterium]
MKKAIRYYFEKLLSILKVRQNVGGVEISDLALRFANFDGENWRISGVRLEPGILDGGKIKNREKFIEALKTLKLQALGEDKARKKMSIVASLSSISIYSQVFSLPIIEGENLSKAIDLNVQMVSPIEAAQAYSGWQTVGEDQSSLRLEILSAFIDRSVVDGMSQAFRDAGFMMIAMESRALALARLLRTEGVGFDPLKAYILISLDNSGLDFLIIRGGQLYFEYFSPWRDVADDQGQISMPAFEAVITRNLHQVMNFYGQHWKEPLGEVLLSVSAMREDVERIIKSNFSLSATDLKLKTIQSVGPEWYVVLGCGLRGLTSRSRDKEMSLLGIGAREEFAREQLVSFAEFWKLLMPVALGLLVIIFVFADLFLVQTRKSLESQSLFTMESGAAKENELLQTQAESFNQSVKMIASVESTSVSQGRLLEKISGIASSNGVTINRLSVAVSSNNATLNGLADSESKIVAFKDALTADSAFKDINLPLSAISVGPSGLSFSMSFTLNR